MTNPSLPLSADKAYAVNTALPVGLNSSIEPVQAEVRLSKIAVPVIQTIVVFVVNNFGVGVDDLVHPNDAVASTFALLKIPYRVA
jgi:hypothetical protein